MTRYLVFAAIAFACGCGPSFKATTPPSFVEIEDKHDDYDYRATTANGLVIGVREIEHDPKGEPTFWLQAIKNRMRDHGGYALTETVEVTSADGVKGTQLRFGHDEDEGEPYLYYITLFVTPKKLLVVEVGGSKEQLKGQAQEIERAQSSLQVN
jgi:hypothetical protein